MDFGTFAFMGWLLTIILVVGAVVWAVNLGSSVYATQRAVERIEQHLAALWTPAPAPVPTRVTAVPAADPIDIEPFVD